MPIGQIIKIVLVAVCAALSLTSCKDRQTGEATGNVWAEQLHEALTARDVERILLITDSLEQADVISAEMADLLRGRGYDVGWQMRLAEHYYKKAYQAYGEHPEQDWGHYAESGYRWAYLRLSRCDTEGALATATELLSKAEGNAAFPSGVKGALLMLVAECQMQLHQKEAARRALLQAYEAQMEAVKQSGHPDDFNTAVVCINNSGQCCETGDYEEAQMWLHRCEQAMEAYEQYGDSNIIDEWKGHLALRKAVILQAAGHPREAAAVFDAIPRSRIYNPTGISEAIKYLTAAGRHSEAAYYFDRLDSTYVATDGAQLNLENISSRMAPRYLATMKAGRQEDALAIGADICNALDSALIWQKKNEAAELAVIYQTHERELQLSTLNAQLLLHRIIAVSLAIILLLIAYLLRRSYLYNKELMAKNRRLVAEIEQREREEKQAIEQLKAEPEEALTSEQQLFRRICDLMDSPDRIYTNATLDRNRLAQLLGTNDHYVTDAISTCTNGKSLNGFLNEYRLRYAAHLLATTTDSVALIAELAGFARSSFFRSFSDAYGMSPSDYRKVAGK